MSLVKKRKSNWYRWPSDFGCGCNIRKNKNSWNYWH